VLPRTLFLLVFSSTCIIAAAAKAADTPVGVPGNTVAAAVSNTNGGPNGQSNAGNQGNQGSNGQGNKGTSGNGNNGEDHGGPSGGSSQPAPPEVTPGMNVPSGPWDRPR